jgi:hypothetical protein
MKIVIGMILMISLASCKEGPSQAQSGMGYIAAHVFFGDSGIANKQVTLVQTAETRRTDRNGHAVFSVPPGRYFVQAIDIHGGGPGLPRTVTDTVEAISGDTSHVEFFDCIACMSAPQQFPDIAMALDAEPVSGDSIRISVDIANVGSMLRTTWGGCSYRFAAGTGYTILDPTGKEVFLSDPRYRPLCADFIRPFHQGELITGAAFFAGTVFSADGIRSGAQPGTYIVIARFQSYVGGNNENPETVERQVSFEWK